MLLQHYQPIGENKYSISRGHSADFSLRELTKMEGVLFGTNTEPSGTIRRRDSREFRIDLANLARLAEGDVLAFFELLESECKEAMVHEAISVEMHGLTRCIIELSSRSGASDPQDLKSEILTQIDENRRMGEICLPVFNVSVV